VLHTATQDGQLPLDTGSRPASFARLGEEGVDLFMVDSTNSEVPLHTHERDIARCRRRLSKASKQRIIVACFASHVHRVQQIMDAAVKHHRRSRTRRSMVRNMAVAAIWAS